jgi:succinate-acetate transporter protein
MVEKANPAPLGLLAFGLTTVLLNFHNAGFLGADSMAMIMAMGICYGGLAQIIAGVMEFKNGNTFGTTAFVSYGFFWLSLVALLILPQLGLAEAVSPMAMAAYLAMWGIFTLFMYVGTLKLSKSLQVVFLTLTVLFFLLAIADITGSAALKVIAGLEGIVCGLSAVYTAAGQVLNEVYKKTILPL